MTTREQINAEPPPQARLRARPSEGVRGTAPLGLRTIEQTNGREGLLYVPETYTPDRPARLFVTMHGAGSSAQRGLDRSRPLADEYETILFAPQSRGPTWDMLVGGYGPDVAAIDAVLAQIFAEYAVDPSHVALGGFSDGASYGLSLGLANGDVVSHVIAFSPGFANPPGLVGEPGIFVSHGTLDEVLPIDRASRFFVRILRQLDYTIHYVEFEGPHTVPEDVLRTAYEWFTGSGGASDGTSDA